MEREGLITPERGICDGVSRDGLDKEEFGGKKVVDWGGLRMEVGGREGARIDCGFGEELVIELWREGVSMPRSGGITGLGGDMTGGDMTGVVMFVFVAVPVSVSDV